MNVSPNYSLKFPSSSNFPYHWRKFLSFFCETLDEAVQEPNESAKTEIPDQYISNCREFLCFVLNEYCKTAMSLSVSPGAAAARDWWLEEKNPSRDYMLEVLDLENRLAQVQEKIRKRKEYIEINQDKIFQTTLREALVSKICARIKSRYKKEYGFALSLDFRINDIPQKQVGNETYLDYGKSMTGDEKILIVPTTWILENILHFPDKNSKALMRFEFLQNGKKRLRKEIDITPDNYIQSISL